MPHIRRVIVEEVLTRALEKKQVTYLRKQIIPEYIGYNLANDRIKDIYDILTDDSIQQQPFWQKFRESTARRNRIMHKRHIANQQEAEESLEATNALIAYLDQN